jgi:hypothetical protein
LGEDLSRECMLNHDQYPPEIARLLQTAAESCLRVVESQLSLAFTLCAIAETEIRYGRPVEAMKVVDKVWHHAETIRCHIDERNDLSSTAVSDLRNQLIQLKKRTEQIDSVLRRGDLRNTSQCSGNLTP